jgi:hypothetical protein
MQNLIDDVCAQCDLAAIEVTGKVNELVTILRKIPIEHQYHYHSPEMCDFYRGFKLADYGAFHKLVLLALIEGFRMGDLALKMPSSMTAVYDAEFNRVRGLVADDANFVFDWGNDRFAKDMAICSGRLIPNGPGLMEVSGVPRNLLFKKGAGQFFRLLYMIFCRLGRHRPLLENHTHLANVDQFNAEGWQRTYRLAGEILDLNPEIRGFLRGSWFIDPVISEISPRLGYLREIPCRHGADIFYICSEGLKSGSFARSKSRKKLFDEGKYVPKSYLLVWPRKSLIEYANSLGVCRT